MTDPDPSDPPRPERLDPPVAAQDAGSSGEPDPGSPGEPDGGSAGEPDGSQPGQALKSLSGESVGAAVGSFMSGLEQQIFQRRPPAVELVRQAQPVRAVSGDGLEITISVPEPSSREPGRQR